MGKKLLMLFAFGLLLSGTAPALRAQSALLPLSQAQVALIRKIEGRVMAPCCYTQTIRDHDSQVAVEMREEVTAMVASGKSEQEIITYYRTKYGETILVVPDGLTGRLLTATPVLLFIASAGLLVVFIRKTVNARDKPVTQGEPIRREAGTAAIRERIRAEVGELW